MDTIKQSKLLLDKVKLQLLLSPNTVFYSTILFSLKVKWTKDVIIAGVDGLSLYLNPDEFCKFTLDEQIGLILHEVLHIALQHPVRKNDRHHLLWNYAGDIVINNLLNNKGYTLPKGGIDEPEYGKDSTEQVYTKIYKKILKQHSTNTQQIMDAIAIPGTGKDIKYQPTKDKNNAVQQQIISTIMRAKLQAEISNQKPGDIPGEVNIELQKVVNPQLPWNILLQNYLSSFAQNDYSWRKPNRRYLPQYYLPRVYSEAVGDIAIAVDSSGSVTHEEFSYFIQEIEVIQEQMKPEKITLIDFDTKIRNIQIITKETDIYRELSFKGGGGTRIYDLAQWAIKHNPTVLLVFTDGEFALHSSLQKIRCPVIWLIHGRQSFTCNIGKIIKYKIPSQ